MNHAAILPICHRLAIIPPELAAAATILEIEAADAPFTKQISSSLEVAGTVAMLSIRKLRAERLLAATGTREPR